MQLRQLAHRVGGGLKRLATLERVLALVCITIPALLILVDGLPPRGSISEYYNMHRDQVYYVPLTVAAMLFIVNGVVKRKRFYNTVLGTALTGVLLLNRDDAHFWHIVCASIFFGGNGLVILFFSSRKERRFKIAMGIVIVLAMLGCFVFHWLSLLAAEWISLGIITLHYFIESGYDGNGRRQPAGQS